MTLYCTTSSRARQWQYATFHIFTASVCPVVKPKTPSTPRQGCDGLAYLGAPVRACLPRALRRVKCPSQSICEQTGSPRPAKLSHSQPRNSKWTWPDRYSLPEVWWCQNASKVSTHMLAQHWQWTYNVRRSTCSHSYSKIWISIFFTSGIFTVQCWFWKGLSCYFMLLRVGSGPAA